MVLLNIGAGYQKQCARSKKSILVHINDVFLFFCSTYLILIIKLVKLKKKMKAIVITKLLQWPIVPNIMILACETTCNNTYAIYIVGYV